MSLAAILLGLINIGIVIVILVLIGAIIVWFLGAFLEWPVPWNIQRLYLAVVALVALYMLVALLLGIPSVHIIGRVALDYGLG